MSQREQLNLRLPPDWFELLEVAAFFDSVTLSEYVKTMLEDRVVALRKDPEVTATARARAERAAVKSGKVARLQDRREDREA